MRSTRVPLRLALTLMGLGSACPSISHAERASPTSSSDGFHPIAESACHSFVEFVLTFTLARLILRMALSRARAVTVVQTAAFVP